MTTDQLDEAILKAYQKVWPSDETTAVSINFREFASRLIEEVQKQQEPVLYMDHRTDVVSPAMRDKFNGYNTPLYKALEIEP